MQRNNALTTTFKDDALEVGYFTLDEDFVILKVWDNESVSNLILALSLTMEYTVFNMSIWL